jgi:hypothetical protein
LRAAFARPNRPTKASDAAAHRALAELPASPLGFAVTRHAPPRSHERGQGAPRQAP